MPTNPNPKRAEKGLSLASLLKTAIDYTKNSAKSVVVKKLEQKQTKGKLPAVVAVCQTSDMNKKGRPHKVTIIGLDNDQPRLTKQTRLVCDCDCEDHTFTWEFALWTWGAARILRSNGEPAVVKNPRNYPGTCKHVYKVLREIKTHGL